MNSPAGAIARTPLQERAKERFERILVESRKVLLKSGVAGFSIPLIADRLGYTRASIYNFFPTPYAVLNELAQRELSEMEAVLARHAAQVSLRASWRELVRSMVQAAADFYRKRPLACVLLLGGSITDSGFRALEHTIARLGLLARNFLLARNIAVPPAPPDIPALAAEFGTASFRMSYFLHGRITPAYEQAAYDVITAYLAQQLRLPD